MELLLFYITAPLCVLLLGNVIFRHENSGSLQSRNDALARENAELRQKLKKQDEDRDHTFNQLRNYYDQRAEWKQQEIKKGNAVHDEKWETDFLRLLNEMQGEHQGPYMQQQIDKQREAMDARFNPKP